LKKTGDKKIRNTKESWRWKRKQLIHLI